MSLEQAINDHAAAIRELAAALVHHAESTEIAAAAKGAAADLRKANMMVGVHLQEAFESGRKLAEVKSAEAETPKPTDAKAAVAEAKAKAEAAKVQAEASKVAEEIEAKELSYQKDIQPKLVQYFKTHGKPKGMELLAKYGAKTGDGIKAADYPALLADIGG